MILRLLMVSSLSCIEVRVFLVLRSSGVRCVCTLRIVILRMTLLVTISLRWRVLRVRRFIVGCLLLLFTNLRGVRGC